MRAILSFLFGAFTMAIVGTIGIVYQPVTIQMPAGVTHAQAQAWASFFLRDGVYFDMVKQCKQSRN